MNKDLKTHKAFEQPNAARLLSDRRLQAYIFTGVRGSGKSWLIQRILLKNYFRYGDCFILLRESQEEADVVQSEGFWDSELSSQPEFAQHAYEQHANRIIIDGKVVGLVFALTTIGKARGVVASHLGKVGVSKKRAEELNIQLEEGEQFAQNNKKHLKAIFFDEFIPLTPRISDQKRFDMYMHAVETFFRMRTDFKAYLCGNITTPQNTFLQNFRFDNLDSITPGIQKSYTKFTPGYPSEALAGWCHLEPNAAWQCLRQKSFVGKVNRGSESAMFDTGAFTVDSDYPTIEDKGSRHINYILNLNSKLYAVWLCKSGEYHVTEYDKAGKYTKYAWHDSDIKLDILLFPAHLRRFFIEHFKSNSMRFDKYSTYITIKEIINTRRVYNG